jgi:hypothetical protein
MNMGQGHNNEACHKHEKVTASSIVKLWRLNLTFDLNGQGQG